ncbi:MAG: hypothetical protein LRS48_06420 [Desulfurococcales archaeon]|nr:hypothetical protein [Desulfurococcales archaeon]
MRAEPEGDDLTSMAGKAVKTVGQALQFMEPGPILRGPPGGPVDVPVFYEGVPLDIIHYDPYRKAPSPKGRPVHYPAEVDEHEVRSIIGRVLRESYALMGAEYREPEKAWIVPVAWRNLIILHVRVSWDGGGLLPDPGLEARLRRIV